MSNLQGTSSCASNLLHHQMTDMISVKPIAVSLIFWPLLESCMALPKSIN